MANKDRVLIDFQGNRAAIQKYANKHHNGNFSEAVRQLIKKGLE